MKAVVGASGGAMIIAGTSEVLLNHFVKGMDPFSSVTAPRVYHRVYYLILYYFINIFTNINMVICKVFLTLYVKLTIWLICAVDT